MALDKNQVFNLFVCSSKSLSLAYFQKPIKVKNYTYLIQENNTFFIGKVLHQHKELASTNEFALSLLSEGRPAEGTVVCTDKQLAGRGQRGNTWESANHKNLTLSIILYPNFLLARQHFLLNQVISLGVRACVQHFLDEGVSVKWSNDIYVFKKKIAGILIQNSLSGTNIQASIIGIGLNVNQTDFISDAPNPTSLALEKSKIFDLTEVRQVLFYFIEKWYLHLRAKKNDLIRQEYLNQLYLYQEESRFQNTDGSIFRGTIIGIDSIGKLQISTPNGVFCYAFKEIKFLHS